MSVRMRYGTLGFVGWSSSSFVVFSVFCIFYYFITCSQEAQQHLTRPVSFAYRLPSKIWWAPIRTPFCANICLMGRGLSLCGRSVDAALTLRIFIFLQNNRRPTAGKFTIGVLIGKLGQSRGGVEGYESLQVIEIGKCESAETHFWGVFTLFYALDEI